MNVIDASGILAIATRLQRLSDQLRRDGALIYKDNGISFEPKWFPVMYALHQKPMLSVVEIAAEIGYTHPSTISLLKDLEKQKLIRSKKDKSDERKRLLQLTARGNELIEQMRPVWQQMINTLNEMLNTPNNIMAAVNEVETQMQKESFFERSKRFRK